MHPDLEQVVDQIRRQGIIATVITNGYLLTENRIGRLNSAGLDYLQISIDNVDPDGASVKCLEVLDRMLVLLCTPILVALWLRRKARAAQEGVPS